MDVVWMVIYLVLIFSILVLSMRVAISWLRAPSRCA